MASFKRGTIDCSAALLLAPFSDTGGQTNWLLNAWEEKAKAILQTSQVLLWLRARQKAMV